MTINVTDVDEPNSAPVFTEGTSTTRSVAENRHRAKTSAPSSRRLRTAATLGGMDFAAAFRAPDHALNFETKARCGDGFGLPQLLNVTINVTDVDEPN